MTETKPIMMPGWRIKLSNWDKSLVVNAYTEERARELARLWAKDKGKDPTIISCKRMADDEFYVAENERWAP